MDIIKVESAQMGGNCIVNLIYLADGSVISTNEETAIVHTREEWESGMAWFFGCGECPEDETQWEKDNLSKWEDVRFWEYPDVWVHGNGFYSNKILEMSQKAKEQLADHALNIAVSHIQKRIGQHYGDAAGMFFCGEWDALVSKFTDYIDYELAEFKRDKDND
jgi:hypothetical protein